MRVRMKLMEVVLRKLLKQCKSFQYTVKFLLKILHQFSRQYFVYLRLDTGLRDIYVCREKNIPIVKEQWITDCIEKKTSLPLEAYDMAAELPGDHDVPWDKKLPEQEAAVSLMAEVKLLH